MKWKKILKKYSISFFLKTFLSFLPKYLLTKRIFSTKGKIRQILGNKFVLPKPCLQKVQELKNFHLCLCFYSSCFDEECCFHFFFQPKNNSCKIQANKNGNFKNNKTKQKRKKVYNLNNSKTFVIDVHAKIQLYSSSAAIDMQESNDQRVLVYQ